MHQVIRTVIAELDMLDGMEEVTADLGHDQRSVEWRGRTRATGGAERKRK